MAGKLPFVQTSLNLILPIIPDKLGALQLALARCDQDPKQPLRAALKRLGNVHYAQFVFLDLLPRVKPKERVKQTEHDFRLGVFTVYDDDFDDYILSFVEHIGFIFDDILECIEGGEPLRPVREHREEFLEFIRRYDAVGQGVFSAYPDRRAFDIRDAVEIAK